MASSRPVVAKCSLTIREGGPVIEATFNPKEFSIDKTVPWQKHEKSKGDLAHLEFTGAEPKTLAVELFFDTYEEGTNVYLKHIVRLERATLIMEGGKEADRRPPSVIFTWPGMPPFEGVLESLSVKYTMFLADGTPCRATASIKIKQAGIVSAKAERQKAGGGGGGGGTGGTGGNGEGASTTPGSDGSNPRGT